MKKVLEHIVNWLLITATGLLFLSIGIYLTIKVYIIQQDGAAVLVCIGLVAGIGTLLVDLLVDHWESIREED